MEIYINNCKNINNGTISLIEGRLNILYAINGTGKSTVAQAIELSSTPEQLKDLIPYKYLTENPLIDEHQPSVVCTREINNVAVFNEDYVNQYLFLPNDLLANSFEIFIKTDDYDTRMENIQTLMKDIQNAFQENPDLEQLIAELTTFISGFGNAQSGYSRTGSIGKGLAKGNKIANIPTELVEYTPYIQSDINASWLKWQGKGDEFLDLAEKCPYCAGLLPNEQKEVVRQVAIEYNTQYLTELQKMLDVFEALENYFTESVKENINRISRSNTEFSTEEINLVWQHFFVQKL